MEMEKKMEKKKRSLKGLKLASAARCKAEEMDHIQTIGPKPFPFSLFPSPFLAHYIQ